MAKKIYIGVGDKARNVKKMYIGVGGIARRVKKAYIGIGGVARPFLSTEPVEYYGTLNLSESKYALNSATIGDYAIFAGGAYHNVGSTSWRYRSSVDAFNKSLTKVSINSLSTAAGFGSGATVGNYAIFCNDCSLEDNSEEDGLGSITLVEAYNQSLTKVSINPPSESLFPGSTVGLVAANASASSTGQYAIFGGGQNYNNPVLRTYIFAYNSSLTLTTPNTQVPAGHIAATTIANSTGTKQALFVGCSSQTSSLVRSVAISGSLTATNMQTFDREHAAAASNSSYAIFVGGITRSGNYISDDITINFSLTISTIVCGVSGMCPGGCSHSKGAFFAGGGTVATSTIYYLSKAAIMLDNSLTETKFTNSLSKGREKLTGAAVGNYVLFAGGETSHEAAADFFSGTDQTNVIDVYMVN